MSELKRIRETRKVHLNTYNEELMFDAKIWYNQ